MKIGELAEQTGLAPSRIRFYERIGLLKTVKRQANGYRSYPPEAVLVLGMITAAQKSGFSLDELRTLLPADLTQWNHQALTQALRQKIQDIEEIQQRLAENKSRLQEVLIQVEEKPDDIDCATNAKRVWSQVSFGDAHTKPTGKAGSAAK
ncbi:MerR family transcriptional regulator [Halopseudomonas maritima]|uniref:MerR family transcriptional regulator n=1 Tax=Halopseudomonas maritima TaxID=2918528 RepID=UPI001EEA56DD|nr:MerR family transcriptional regulator [Halopseudomonas maritima]UJJ31633.1 MerR family transcriptional regulator [Halopseudomonas maritima]